ncbi:MAG: hypothetical protein ABH846_01245 [Patescibacteria group bacterium]
MKTKIIASALGIILLGAGCLGGGGTDSPDNNDTDTDGTAASNWDLAFDLPEGWIVSSDYSEGSIMPSAEGISPELTDIVIQSTDKNIMLKEIEDIELSEDQIETESYTRIQVYRYTPRKSVPDNAEDLGNGFYKAEFCKEGDACDVGGRTRYDYYFRTEHNLFVFLIHQKNQDIQAAEGVILTATETEFAGQ